MTHEIIIAGFGGQGVLSMGQLLVRAGLNEGKEVSWLPSYGPEMRGGAANCSVIISDEPVVAPIVTDASCLMAMNRPSLEKFAGSVVPGGLVLVNSSLIDIKVERTDVTVYYIPCNDLANELGNAKVAGNIMLGAFLAATNAVQPEHVEASLEYVFKKKQHLIELNKKAIEAGEKTIKG
ncbi:MAG: 2-oxoacid:ferredoxin oxidoreductase subunit gamma [Selenomonadales bacterium]|jgi:pyruvate/ketoisovalerate oxidoreductase, gamma subunit|nr:2-oxoacid:acceptor oxidoreductase family protein [Clostridiales bacterium]PWL99491.1 MAG: 2-oxoacid:ferredoxin oxidoreductase subunit gamma [Selenomonadales bacterium]